MVSSNKKLAIIAGNGDLPPIVAKSASDLGFSTCAIAVTNEAKSKLGGICNKVYRFSPGQVYKIIEQVKKELTDQIVFIGKVPKVEFLKGLHKLDWLAFKNLARLTNFNDDSIHKSIVDLLSEFKIEVLPQTMFLKHLFIEKEVLSKRKPTLEERIDIEYGFDVAKKVSSLDIGQAVVVKNKMILAIEAIEGTDEAIKRGCKLANGKEVVVAKVSKPDQDERFDIPVIGENTIIVLAKCGGGILAFEASKTIVSDKEKVTQAADKNNICLVAI